MLKKYDFWLTWFGFVLFVVFASFPVVGVLASVLVLVAQGAAVVLALFLPAAVTFGEFGSLTLKISQTI